MLIAMLILDMSSFAYSSKLNSFLCSFFSLNRRLRQISISISMSTSITNQRFLYFALKQGLSNRVDSATVRCMEMLTPYQWGADEPIVYLDRQNVECPKPYSLTKMRLLRGGKDNNQVTYYYTCCKIAL